MNGVEIDFVVSDSLAAFAVYQKVFGAQAIEKTSYERGLNEVVFTIFGSRFHILDESPQYGLFAPKEGQKGSMWLNIAVDDIKAVFEKAAFAGFKEIQGIKELPDFGIKNSIQVDPFGYVWMLHQIEKIVSFEERIKILETGMKKQ